MESAFTIERVEEIINWTLPGLTMYYRDSQLSTDTIRNYQVGQIFRSPSFVDVSSLAGQLTKNCRFIIASSKAAPLYKIDKSSEKWKLHVMNANSVFKILDIYQVGEKTQIFLLHIPARGVEFFQNSVLKLKDDDIESQIIEKARESLNQKLAMPPIAELEQQAWIERTSSPVGLDNNNQFVSLQPSGKLPAMTAPLASAIRKMTADTDLNVALVDNVKQSKNGGGFWKKLFK